MRPADPNDPGDPAFDWAIYDRLVRYATQNNIKVVFSILFTPGWANGNKARTVAPTNFKDLENFAYAAPSDTAVSGLPRRGSRIREPDDEAAAPKVNMWTAWNEPNNPIWLSPQYKRSARSGGSRARSNTRRSATRSTTASFTLSRPAADEHVACGVTGPKGNDAPATKRASVDPLTFLTQAHRFGMKTFDVYAHHPYPDIGKRVAELRAEGQVQASCAAREHQPTLKLISQYYGPKHLWITEFGYQTNPPDKTYGSRTRRRRST